MTPAGTTAYTIHALFDPCTTCHAPVVRGTLPQGWTVAFRTAWHPGAARVDYATWHTADCPTTGKAAPVTEPPAPTTAPEPGAPGLPPRPLELLTARDDLLSFTGGRGVVVVTAVTADLHRTVPLLFDARDLLARLPELTQLCQAADAARRVPYESTTPTCGTCGSRTPRLHPATAAEGEVTAVCPDAFHRDRT